MTREIVNEPSPGLRAFEDLINGNEDVSIPLVATYITATLSKTATKVRNLVVCGTRRPEDDELRFTFLLDFFLTFFETSTTSSCTCSV